MRHVAKISAINYLKSIDLGKISGFGLPPLTVCTGKGCEMDHNRIALGKRIKTLRESANLTQAQLAEKAGISLKHLGELERGRANPRLSSLENISQSLGISIVDLLDSDHEKLADAEMVEKIREEIGGIKPDNIKYLYRILRILSE